MAIWADRVCSLPTWRSGIYRCRQGGHSGCLLQCSSPLCVPVGRRCPSKGNQKSDAGHPTRQTVPAIFLYFFLFFFLLQREKETCSRLNRREGISVCLVLLLYLLLLLDSFPPCVRCSGADKDAPLYSRPYNRIEDKVEEKMAKRIDGRQGVGHVLFLATTSRSLFFSASTMSVTYFWERKKWRH